MPGPARTFAVLSVIFASTGAGVGGGRVAVGRRTTVDSGVFVARTDKRVGVGRPLELNTKFAPTKRTIAQKSNTTAPMASGIHSRLVPAKGVMTRAGF